MIEIQHFLSKVQLHKWAEVQRNRKWLLRLESSARKMFSDLPTFRIYHDARAFVAFFWKRHSDIELDRVLVMNLIPLWQW